MTASLPASKLQSVVLDTISTTIGGRQSLLQMLATKEPHSYDSDSFTLSAPTALSGDSAIVDVQVNVISGINTNVIRNTRVVLAAADNKGMFITPAVSTNAYEKKALYYNRIHVTDMPSVQLYKGYGGTVHELLEQYTQETGLLLTTDDVENDILPPADGNDLVVIPLNIKATSLRYYSTDKIDESNYAPPSMGGGANGLSAYQVALAGGFVGTQAAWLLSLKGADGTVSLTVESIIATLGYTPANAAVLANIETALNNINGV